MLRLMSCFKTRIIARSPGAVEDGTSFEGKRVSRCLAVVKFGKKTPHIFNRITGSFLAHTFRSLFFEEPQPLQPWAIIKTI